MQFSRRPLFSTLCFGNILPTMKSFTELTTEFLLKQHLKLFFAFLEKLPSFINYFFNLPGKRGTNF